ncbi:MAG TPA: UDP-N-acetylglucosamine 2-epimerase (non-hydrolyzing) [Stellaceae bacterium]|nr:UDP-N-acetylglucosamine 2-epimerase (non-hydrolyzing) [Stellaceae bacterium]
MSRQLIHLIAAARPNFMKIAPIYHALLNEADWAQAVIVHTGQHYDHEMSAAFFADLGMPQPSVNLEVGSGSHAEQTGSVMIAYERYCQAHRPDWVIVVGDVNSTLACGLVAKKLNLPLAHLEAGLRSGDRTMPEEINRIVTDSIADLLWTPSEDADENLRNEGVPAERIVRVGNVMIDSYELVRDKIEAADVTTELGLAGAFGVVTLHRPSNVDSADTLRELMQVLAEISRRASIVFAVHPRTAARLKEFGLEPSRRSAPGLRLIEPMGYIRFMGLVRKARFVITDSGGVQEETTYLDIPCLTLRATTERPVTVTHGSNRLLEPHALAAAVEDVLAGSWPHGRRPPLWDGHTAGRVIASLRKRLPAAFTPRKG